MTKAFRTLSLVFGLLACAPSAWPFSPIGVAEPYQVPELGYGAPLGRNPDWRDYNKNIDDEYRWNTPKLYYTYDPEFISYFGSNGMAAIDGAFESLNRLTNVSEYTADLSEFPLESRSVNYAASALGLLDLRTYAFQSMVERYGLGDPQAAVWNLRNRALPGGATCPFYEYSVIKRNFDPITWEPSSYVNGSLFTYQILEFCPAAGAIAQEILVNPLGVYDSAVASGGRVHGVFYRGVSRDDIGGIRYLLTTNNLNWEQTPNNTSVVVTNTSQTEILDAYDLQLLTQQAATNDAAGLEALYPGLEVTSTTSYLTNLVEATVTASFVTSPYAPVGSPPDLLLSTTLTTNAVIRYSHTYGNITTNAFSTNCPWSVSTTRVEPSPYAPVGGGISETNVTFETFISTNTVCGSFYILPTNATGYDIVATGITQVIITTNVIADASIDIDLGTNGSAFYGFSQSILTYFTNTPLVVYPVNSQDVSITSLFQGIERVSFERRDYDSLLGQFFEPVDYDFTLTEVTNNRRQQRRLQRTVNSPDIVFSADDITSGPTGWPFVFPFAIITTPSYSTPTNANPNGPGTINPGASITFNKVGPYLRNSGTAFISEQTAFPGFVQWGSFDGTTNAPIVYPVGTDLQTLEQMAVINLSQPSTITNGSFLLPDGGVGLPYNGGSGFQLEVVGGTSPYVWDALNALPGGLTLSSSGLVSGTPTTPGIYDFTARMTEAGARNVEFPFTLTVSP